MEGSQVQKGPQLLGELVRMKRGMQQCRCLQLCKQMYFIVMCSVFTVYCYGMKKCHLAIIAVVRLIIITIFAVHLSTTYFLKLLNDKLLRPRLIFLFPLGTSGSSVKLPKIISEELCMLFVYGVLCHFLLSLQIQIFGF